MAKPQDSQKQVVFFDFDNTITTQDVLDDMLLKFSEDDRWADLEKSWKNKEIGSLECLKGQVEGIRVKKEVLDEYLSKVEIDPYFKKLIGLLNSRKIRTIIVSDNFDYILKRILKAHALQDLEMYSNRLKIMDGRLVPNFPHNNKECGDCAHCKKTTLAKTIANGERTVYIGDGLSDACASKEADIIFAKDYLEEHLQGEGIEHIPFNDLKDVYSYFQRSLQ